MNDCSLYRKKLAADPGFVDPPLSQHLESCSGCAEFADQIRELDQSLGEALQVKIPDSLQAKLEAIPAKQKNRSIRNFTLTSLALAATIVLGIGISSLMVPPPMNHSNLQQVVYKHIMHEPQALGAISRVKQAVVNSKLRKFGIELSGQGFQSVIYVRLCPIGDIPGLHLVVAGDQGPITFLFMPTGTLKSRLPFKKGRFAGYIAPIAVGLVAVVGEEGERLEHFDDMIKQSVRWL